MGQDKKPPLRRLLGRTPQRGAFTMRRGPAALNRKAGASGKQACSGVAPPTRIELITTP